MVDTVKFYEYLVNHDLDFFTGVPDSLLKEFCACVSDKSDNKHNIIAANEGNAIGLAAGYHLSTGKIGVVYMQNSGEGNAVNPLMSLADPKVYSIPMLLIIGWRGEPGVHDEPQHVKQGEVTLKLLEAMDIEYRILSDNYEVELNYLISLAKKENRPTALIVRKGTISKYQSIGKDKTSTGELLREEALEIILEEIGDDMVVSTTGKESREIFEIREKKLEGHSHDFLTVGSMGHTSSIALGVSIGTHRNIWCLDGDGSFIMHMGGLAIAGVNAGKNFKYIINNNAAHESVGGQPTISNKIDIKSILIACGFSSTYEAKTKEEIRNCIIKMKNEDKCALILYTKQGSRDDLGRPTKTPVQNKEAFMAEIKKNESLNI